MKPRFLLPVAVLCLCLGAGGLLWAQDEPSAALEQSEEEFFASADVEAAAGQAEIRGLAEELDRERVGLSGNLEASGSYFLTREFLRGDKGLDDNELPLMVQGDFLVDVRLKKGFRAFLDLSIGYLAGGAPVPHSFTVVSPFLDSADDIVPAGTVLLVTEEATTLIGLKEVFVDFNIANAVYFRVGKQVLQWGRGILWNPTDLINVQRKSFQDLEALREGVFGLRADVVFARAFHLYTFFDLNGVQDLSDIAVAARAEFLVGSVEFAFSGWARPSEIPVFGFNLSAPLFWDLSFHGEASLSWGFPVDKMRTNGDTYPIRDELVPRVSVGLSRSFDAGDVQDRIVVNTEFYYNHLGYGENMFEVLAPDPVHLAAFLAGYYRSGDYGKYYGALFVTFNRFLTTNMTLNVSGLGNFSDLSFIAMANLSYAPVNNFTLSFTLGSYLGSDLREYTVLRRADGTLGGGALSASLGARVAF